VVSGRGCRAKGNLAIPLSRSGGRVVQFICNSPISVFSALGGLYLPILGFSSS
jgi:hypothetical protein